MKFLGAAFSGLIAVLLISGFVSQAHAAQLTAFLIPDRDKSLAIFTGVRLIEMRYAPGSSIGNQLNCERESVTFGLNGTLAEDGGSGLSQIIGRINEIFVRELNSPVQIQQAVLNYTGVIKCQEDRTQISYKVEFIPTIEQYVLQKGEGDQGDVVDLDWKALVVNQPLIVNTNELSEFDVNSPVGLIKAKYPDLAAKLQESGAKEIMEDPILAFEDFGTPMKRWHFLFDASGSQAGAAGYGFEEESGARVVSIYSLGESSFREGTHLAKEKDATVNIDGTDIKIHAQTPPPSGQLQVAGFSKIVESEGNEFLVVTRDAPEGAVAATGGFPIQVLLVFGGMMGAIAVFILFKARK